MSFQLYGDNRQENIEADVTYEEGDYLIADPGLDECSSRMLFLRELQNTLISGTPLEKPYQLHKAPDFGSNKYAFPFVSNNNYYVETIEEFAYNDSITITHLKEPSGKRYVECWVTYYPTTGFTPVLDSGTHLIAGSSFFMKNPRLYPDLIQSLNIPGNDTSFLPNYDNISNTHIRLHDNAELMVLWGDTRAAIYEWNAGNTEYDLAYDFNVATCTQIHSVGLHEDWVVVAYADSGETEIQWAYIEKSGTWSITGTWNEPSECAYTGPVHLYKDTNDTFILHGCNANITIAFDKATRSVQHYAYDLSSLWVGSNYYLWPYSKNAGEVKTWGADQWSFGGPLHWYPSYMRFRGAYAAVSYDNGYGTFLKDENGNAQPENSFLMCHAVGDLEFMMLNISVDPYQLIMYPQYINAHDNENLRGFEYINYSSFCIDDYFMYFRQLPNDSTPGVYWAPDNTEVVRLEDFVLAVNKVYNGCFYPIKYPYFISNNGDNTLKLTELGKHHTEVIGDGVLKITTANPIAKTTNFVFPTEPTNTTSLFRLSWDNVTFYKWNGVDAWVTEASASAGNTLTDFIAGCVAGITAPGSTYTAYIGVYVTCSADDADYIIDYADVKLYLTTASSLSAAYLCDDSMVEIEHVSDTETKITSKTQQTVILSAQVCLIAPPYDVEYED